MSIPSRRLFITSIAILLLMQGPYIYGQLIKTISADFSREYKEGNKKETIKGSIYYQAATKKVVIKVDYPVNQWMILQGNETIIYYPDELRAFRIISRNPAYMPFFQAFISALKEDYGLTDGGYTFASYKRNGNKLVSYWNPPKKLTKILGQSTLKYIDNKLTYAESKNAKGKILSEAYFKNHILYGGTYFPIEISITKRMKSSSSLEEFILKDPQFNSSLPQEIIGFKIPKEVKVKEVKW